MAKKILVGVDFETDAIEPRPAYPPKPVGVAIRRPGSKARYVSWGHPEGNNATEADGLRELKLLWKDPDARIAFHNGKFDQEVALVHMGLPLLASERVEDSMILAFLDDPYRRNLGLKPLAESLLGEPPEERDILRDWIVENVPAARAAKTSWGKFICAAPGNLVGPYAKGDVDRTLGLVAHLHPRIESGGMLEAYQRELRLIPVLVENERAGLPVDVRRLRRDVKIA
jgi:DNA polymerase I-like protein with 3'-5' exonuclease and polymerase domains